MSKKKNVIWVSHHSPSKPEASFIKEVGKQAGSFQDSFYRGKTSVPQTVAEKLLKSLHGLCKTHEVHVVVTNLAKPIAIKFRELKVERILHITEQGLVEQLDCVTHGAAWEPYLEEVEEGTPA